MAAKKNSLVGNINRRKKKGTSRLKSRSTISGEAYEQMQEGWPKQPRKRAAKKKKKKTRTRKSGAKKTTKKRAAKRSRK